jgi:hypothetical protein
VARCAGDVELTASGSTRRNAFPLASPSPSKTTALIFLAQKLENVCILITKFVINYMPWVSDKLGAGQTAVGPAGAREGQYDFLSKTIASGRLESIWGSGEHMVHTARGTCLPRKPPLDAYTSTHGPSTTHGRGITITHHAAKYHDARHCQPATGP